MSEPERPVFPIVGQEPVEQDDEAPSCPPKVYVSNEEAAVLRAMRGVKEAALGIRQELADASDDADRRVLEARLGALRAEWSELARQRELAFRRKMVMLGHLPPEALEEG